MVRPEQLDVHVREDDSGEHAAGLPGRVEQCRYYGHDALLHIRPEPALGPGRSSDTKPANDTEPLLARVRGEQALAIGTPVSVAAHGPATLLH